MNVLKKPNKYIALFFQETPQFSSLCTEELAKAQISFSAAPHITDFHSLLTEETRCILINKESIHRLHEIKTEKKRYGFSIFCLSNDDSFQTRLNALRAGVDKFFIYPYEDQSFLRTLTDLAYHTNNTDYTTLIIDMTAENSSEYIIRLQDAGIQTAMISNPIELELSLIDTAPELIIINEDLGICSGIELAQLIRQHDTYLGIPIYLLCLQYTAEKTAKALNSGIDACLPASIGAEKIVHILKKKIISARKVRNLLEKDSLTGVLNRANLELLLQRELYRAERREEKVSFVMLDLDHFKNVNDNYGHLVGDKVLKALTKTLTENLRRMDIIGRFGGEEFGIILVNTDMQNAQRVMDTIRLLFSAQVFTEGSESFSVTFSCGVAEYPSCQSLQKIILKADEALYLAKETGRNKVLTSS